MGNRTRNRLGGGEASKSSYIDKWQSSQPRRGGSGDIEEAPAQTQMSSHAPGKETKYDREAWEGNPNDHNPISVKGAGKAKHEYAKHLGESHARLPHHSAHGAHTGHDLRHSVDHLHDEHPHNSHGHIGPGYKSKGHEHHPHHAAHHGKHPHVRHEPLHGMHPKAHHGRKGK